MKKIFVGMIILLGLICVIGGSKVFAADTMSLEAVPTRPYSDDDRSTTVGDDVYKVQRTALHTIFKIHQVGDAEFLDTIYCLRGGLGFGAEVPGTLGPLTYTKVGDIITNPEILTSPTNSALQTIYGSGITGAQYNGLKWIIDNMWLPKYTAANPANTDTERQEQRDNLLKAAFEEYFSNLASPPSDIPGAVEARLAACTLTDDDIDVIQQLAIWYFSNYDEQSNPNSLSIPSIAAVSNLLRINPDVYPPNGYDFSTRCNKRKQRSRYGYIKRLFNNCSKSIFNSSSFSNSK